MILVIIFGILTVGMMVSLVLPLGFYFFDSEEIHGTFRWMDIFLAVVHIGCVLVMTGLFCLALSNYTASHVGYSSSEYQIEKKIITSVENCTEKTDTVYFFEKK